MQTVKSTLLSLQSTKGRLPCLAVVSILCFGLEPTLPLGLGILVASISVVLYYVPPARLAQVESPRAGHYEKLQPFADTGGKLPK